MTQLQKQFYRAVYESNVKFLLQLTGKKKQRKSARDEEGIVDKVSVPSLMNICMQLRHVCNVSAMHSQQRKERAHAEGRSPARAAPWRR